MSADSTLRAIEGCDLVYDCIGLPGDQMHLSMIETAIFPRAGYGARTICLHSDGNFANVSGGFGLGGGGCSVDSLNQKSSS